jgi:acetyl esterase/lipase
MVPRRRIAQLLPIFPALLLSPLLLVAQTAGVRITPDVIYGHKDGMALTYDVFQPEEGSNGVGIVSMVSGGWVSTWIPPEQAAARYRFLLDQGFTVFAVRHGSSPRYMVPEAFSDVKRASRHIGLQAERFGVDPDRLGVWGGSAGGHLSLMLGFTQDEGDPLASDPIERAPSRFAAIVAYYPPTDLRRMVGPSERFPALNFDRELAPGISPVLHVDGSTLPVLLIHGDADTLVPLSHSRVLMEEMLAHGVPAQLIVLPGAGHGFQGEDLVHAQAALSRWFREHLVE